MANLARYRKWFFFSSIWDLKIYWFPVGPFGLTFVTNNWWGVWPSCQMMKKCCWPIWAPKSEKNVRPKKHFSQIWFMDRKKKFGKKSYQHPYNNSPLSGPIVEKRVGSFSWQYCQFGPILIFLSKNQLTPSGDIWANVCEKWLMGRLTVLPNDEEML